MFQLFLFTVLLIFSNLHSQPIRHEVQWKNGIGRCILSPTSVCYIRIQGNKIERLYLDGNKYLVTQQICGLFTPGQPEHPINKSPENFIKDIVWLQQKFNTPYIPAARIKEMLDMSSFEKFKEIN